VRDDPDTIGSGMTACPLSFRFSRYFFNWRSTLSHTRSMAEYRSSVDSNALMVIPRAVRNTSAMWRYFSTDKVTCASNDLSTTFPIFPNFPVT
jgi:hypothetical protein